MVDQPTVGFVQNQLTSFDMRIYRVEYQPIQFQALVPIDMSDWELAESITSRTLDVKGQTGPWEPGASAHLANTAMNQFTTPTRFYDASYEFNDIDVRRAMAAGVNLPIELARGAMRAYMQELEAITFNGDSTMNWSGLIKNPLTGRNAIPAVTLEDTAGGGTNPKYWMNKTALEIRSDLVAMAKAIYNNTKGRYRPDTFIVPVDAFYALHDRIVPDTSVTFFNWLLTALAPVCDGGMPPMIDSVFGLENAGASNVGRIVAYKADPEVLRLKLPMPLRFLDEHNPSPTVFQRIGLYSVGGLDIKQPQAMCTADNVSA